MWPCRAHRHRSRRAATPVPREGGQRGFAHSWLSGGLRRRVGATRSRLSLSGIPARPPLGPRQARLARKRFVQQTAKIHSHEKETVCFLPGRVGCTNNFDYLEVLEYQFNSNFPAETLVTAVPLQKKIRFCTAFWMPWTKYDHNKIHTIRQNARNTLLLLILVDPKPVSGMAGHPRYWLPSLFIR